MVVKATRHLDIADRIAPTRTRNDPLARDLVLTLERRARRQIWELDSLGNRLGTGSTRPKVVRSAHAYRARRQRGDEW